MSYLILLNVVCGLLAGACLLIGTMNSRRIVEFSRASGIGKLPSNSKKNNVVALICIFAGQLFMMLPVPFNVGSPAGLNAINYWIGSILTGVFLTGFIFSRVSKVGLKGFAMGK